MVNSHPISFPIPHHAFRTTSLLLCCAIVWMVWDSNICRGKRLFSPCECLDRDKFYLLSCRYGISHIVSVKTKYASCSTALLMQQEQHMKYHAPDIKIQASLHLAMFHAVGFLALHLPSDLQTATLGFSGFMCTHLSDSYCSVHLVAPLKKTRNRDT